MYFSESDSIINSHKSCKTLKLLKIVYLVYIKRALKSRLLLFGSKLRTPVLTSRNMCCATDGVNTRLQETSI